MKSISDEDYNDARDILIAAGSKTAEKSHKKHTKRAGSPGKDGKSLLAEARDEFRKADAGKADLVSDMTKAHHKAVKDAADKMGITSW